MGQRPDIPHPFLRVYMEILHPAISYEKTCQKLLVITNIHTYLSGIDPIANIGGKMCGKY